MKRDLSRLPALTPELLRSDRPAGPVQFSLNDAPERQRPSLYRDFFARSVMGVDVEPFGETSFNAAVMLQPLPGLQIFSGRVYGSRNRRTPELLADGRDEFTLFINLGGPYLISQGAREQLLDDGAATLVSTGDPCSFMHHPPGAMLCLRFPRNALGALVDGIEDLCLRPIRAATPALRLITDYVRLGREEPTFTDGPLRRLFVMHVHDLIASALGASRDGSEVVRHRGLRAARLHAVKQDVDRNLDQADLSVGAVAARHGCTPRFIQRLFETEGTTFTAYALAQRLARAHDLLSDPLRRADKITAVALDCGFGDVSYFNRVFRRRYGAAPSDVRAGAQREALAGARCDI
jgi:AraC-like DNA-binding protein